MELELYEACIDDVSAEAPAEESAEETTPEAVSGRWALAPAEAAAFLICMMGSPMFLD